MKIVSLQAIKTTTTSHNAAGRKKQLIAPGEVPHLIQFAQATLIPGEIVPGHKHTDLYEVFFVESGNGIMRIDGNEHAIEEGTCITIEPNEHHEVENTGKEPLTLTYFAILV